MAELIPVDHDPFAQASAGPQLIPVDHDPFALAVDPAQAPAPPSGPSAPLAAFQPPNFAPQPSPQQRATDPFWQNSTRRAEEARQDDAKYEALGQGPRKASSVPLDQRGYAPVEAAIQGGARTAADLAGMPVDLITMLHNAARGVINTPGAIKSAITGQPDKSKLSFIEKPPGGSDWFADRASEVASAAGVEPLDYDSMDARGKTAYQATRFGLAGALQGFGLRGVAAARAPSDKPRIADVLLDAYEGQHAGKAVARDAVAGVGTGTGIAAADTMLPEDYRGPFTSLLAGLTGGVGATTLSDALTLGPKATYAWATAGRPDRDITFNPDGSYVSKATSRDAAKFLQAEAGGPTAAREAADTIGRNADEFVAMGAPVPTTGQISENAGLARVERGVRNTSTPAATPIFERDRAINTYAGQQIRGMGPEGADPNQFPNAAGQVAADMRRPVEADLARTQAGQESIGAQRLAEGAALADGAATRQTTASQQMDNVITGDMRNLRSERADALRSSTIDPTNEVRLDANPIYDAADRALEAGVNLPDAFRKRVPGASELAGRRPHDVTVESPILDASGAPITRTETRGVADMSLTELNVLRPELAQLSDTYAKAIGNGNTSAIKQREAVDGLRTAINHQLRGYAETGGTPQSERLAKGLQAGDEFNARYRTPGPGDPVVELYGDMRKERGDLAGRTLTPPEQTAGRFIKPPAQGGIQGMQSLNRVMETSSDPMTIVQARRDFLVGLAAQKIVENGKVSPKRLGRFIDEYGPVLAHAPESKVQFDSMIASARAGKALEDGFTQAVEAVKGRLKLTDAEIADSALATVMGTSGRKGVQAIIGSRNPPAQMADLAARIEKVPGGTDSLRRALADYLADRVTNTNRQATTDGGLPPSYSKLVGLEKDPDLDRVIAAAWKDDPSAMQALQRARRVLEPREFLATVQGTSGSPTASNMAAAMRVLELGLRTVQGGFRGGNTARNIKVGLGSLLKGRDEEVVNLVARSQVDPAVARHLLSKELPENPELWASKMRKILNWEEAARQTNEEDE
ncbi:hypothetical protein [Bosea sp. PAMC 26642]|uniref:hypothetical protein n=1 Tax=Bosea sp. (strain PAMC 26642) TaxID=1792307 RepID=UPI0007702CA2|nr:hypothetical protein [Bosea sp. PAMC 26642]AMJ63255.1 hypothetical protein AXW83_25755 [Bosea sp. PAMC 26642]